MFRYLLLFLPTPAFAVLPSLITDQFDLMLEDVIRGAVLVSVVVLVHVAYAYIQEGIKSGIWY